MNEAVQNNLLILDNSVQIESLRDDASNAYRQGNYQACLAYFEQLKKYTALNNKDIYEMGLAHEAVGQLVAAENCYYVALRKMPKNKHYLKHFQTFMRSQDLGAQFLAYVQKIIALKPEKTVDLQIFLIDYYIAQKDFTQALYHALEANAIIPQHADLLKLIIYIYNKKKMFRQGLCIAKQLIALHPKDFQANVLLKNMYLKNNLAIQPLAENVYNFLDVRQEQPSDTLTIVFSSLEGKFILKNYEFKTDKLFLSENKMTFYTYAFESLRNYLIELISTRQYKKVNLVGSSKGSFAAMNVGMALADALKQVSFQVVAFSPQTQLFPINKNIEKLPSYRTLNTLAKHNISIQSDLENYGNLEKINAKMTNNIKIFTFYGEFHERDKKECLRVVGFNGVELKPVVDYPFHTTILLFTKKGDALINGLTARFSATVKTDDDFFAPENADELTQKFLKSIDQHHYNLNDYLL